MKGGHYGQWRTYQYLTYFIFTLDCISTFLPVQGVKQITTADLKSELKNKGKQFIDVRTPHEFRTRHIQGFKTFPCQICFVKPINFRKIKKFLLFVKVEWEV